MDLYLLSEVSRSRDQTFQQTGRNYWFWSSWIQQIWNRSRGVQSVCVEEDDGAGSPVTRLCLSGLTVILSLSLFNVITFLLLSSFLMLRLVCFTLSPVCSLVLICPSLPCLFFFCDTFLFAFCLFFSFTVIHYFTASLPKACFFFVFHLFFLFHFAPRCCFHISNLILCYFSHFTNTSFSYLYTF